MDAVQELKDRLSLADLVAQYITLTQDGERLVGRCPFPHGGTPDTPIFEDSASFNVFPNNTFYCFGCKKGDHKEVDLWGRRQFGNDVIAFWREIRRQQTGEEEQFGEALSSLATHAGLPHLVSAPRASGKTLGLLRLRAEQADRWAKYLASAPHVVQYLTNRGVSEEVRHRFRLGFVNERDVEQIQYHVSIPIRNASTGQIIAFGFRSLEPDADPKYVNSANNEIWKKSDNLFGLHEAGSAISRSRMAILTEDYFGPLVMASAGIENVIGLISTSLSEKQIALIRRRTDTVYWWMEDGAGLQALVRMAEPMLQSGTRFFVIDAKMDADEFALKYEMDKRAILQAMHECSEMAVTWLVKYHAQLVDSRQVAVDSALQSLSVILNACTRPADRALMGREIRNCFDIDPVLLLEAKQCRTTVTSG